MKALDDIIQFIKDHDRFVITSHARPDGDAIGSELGLALMLEKLGKTAHIFNADPHPRPYQSLPGIERIQVTHKVEGNYDGLFLLECNDLQRSNLQGLDQYFVINIDHHPKTEPFGDLNWLDDSAAAVGEMIYELAQPLQVQLTPEIATNLYVAIFTDTGSFQYSNTRAKTFLITGDLVNHGASPSAISQAVYMTRPYARLQILGMLLNTLQIHSFQDRLHHPHSGNVREDGSFCERYGRHRRLPPLYGRGLIWLPFFREEAQGRYRVSLRSKNHYDVSTVSGTLWRWWPQERGRPCR